MEYPDEQQLLNQLNEKQKQAVIAPRQPILMLAGPGTGKTRTLIMRILYEIIRYHIPPEQVLALTFSNKAANEITQRLHQEIPQTATRIRCGTFHSVCLDILRKYPDLAGLNPHFSICDDAYQMRLLTHLMKDRVFGGVEQKARGVLLSFSNYLLKGKPLPAFSASIYELYEKHLQNNKLIDYNQILVKTLHLLKENADVLEQYRFMNQSILVDEFQDTDPVQYQIVKILAEKHRNIFVVADDDQSIYAWRGAQPENIRNFMADFFIEQPILLEHNYRSGQDIINTAQAVVANTDRIEPDKNLQSDPEQTSQLKALTFGDENREIQYITRKIIDWQHTARVGLEEIAIIYPRHSFADKIIPYLLREKIPFQQANGRNLVEQPRMKTILLYLRLIHNPRDILILEDLVRDELGYHVFKQIQDLQNAQKITFRQAITEIVNRQEVSYQVRNQISTFIGTVANLVNLKSFYRFDQLVQEIINGMLKLKPSILEHNSSRLREVPFKFHKQLKKESARIWIYHSVPQICFIAGAMLRSVFGERVFTLEKEKIIHLRKTDFVLLLEKLNTDQLPCPYETIFTETTDRRRGVVATLFRWIQIQLHDESKLFENYVVFDLETTGKDPETCDIVEIAAVRVREGKIVAEFQELVKPGRPIETEAQKVHHITPEMVESAPTIDRLWARFEEFIGNDMLLAHNGYHFDFKILDRVSKTYSFNKLTNVRYDTLIFARNLYPGKQNSIDALAERYKLDAGTRHRALDDVRVLHEIFQQLLRARQRREIHTAGMEFTEYVALAGMLENTLTATEDKILFAAGVPRLLSPYSNLRPKYTSQFSIDDAQLCAALERIAGRNALKTELFGTEDDFFQQVLTMAREFSPLHIDKAIAEFLSFVALINPQDQLSRIDAVSLLTFHAAKGLEFEKVIIMGLEDGNMPSYFATKNDDQDDRPVYKKLEEQKRLLYVGITRSKSEVVFTIVQNRDGRKQKISPFLAELRGQIQFSQVH